MKQRDIKNCANCGEGIGKSMFFYRVSVEQMILNPRALQQIHGLEQMLGAAAPLASVLGTDPDIASGTGRHDVLLCGDCGSLKEVNVHLLMEGEE